MLDLWKKRKELAVRQKEMQEKTGFAAAAKKAEAEEAAAGEETKPAEAASLSGTETLQTVPPEVSLKEPEGQPVYYSSFLLGGGDPDAGERSFFRQLKRQAARRLEQLESGSHAPDRKPCPLKAGVEIGTDDKALTAWIFLFPPLLGAGDITPEEIRSALKEQGIVFGVDEAMIQTLCSGPVYLKLAVIARGTGPVAGRDGWIRDYVPRERPKNFFAETERTVDYKSLNLYRQINAGDLICEIVPPEPPVPGKDVKGQVIPGKEGRLPRLPGGRNTLVSQDGLRLTAKTDGQITFQNGLFQISQVTEIQGNVDNSTGNIDVIGDLLIHGDVLSGFNLKATGDIIVDGVVEDCIVTSGGSIRIKQGMNGSGTLTARENIYSKFLENCTVWAGASVQAECLINCHTSSNGYVSVKKGKGVIIGGTIHACSYVEANSIGNLSQSRTILNLGLTAELMKDKLALEEEVQALKAEIEEMQKNLSYLERADKLQGCYLELYNTLKGQLAARKTRQLLKASRLKQINSQQRDLSGCYVRCNTIYPYTYINIGPNKTVVSSSRTGCYYHLGKNGIEEV